MAWRRNSHPRRGFATWTVLLLLAGALSVGVAVVLISEISRPAADSDDPTAVEPACADVAPQIDRALELRRADAWLDAERLYRETLVVARARGCRFLEGRADNGLGSLAALQSRLIEALEHFAHAADAAEVVSRQPSLTPADLTTVGRFAALVQHNRGATWLRLGWLDEALDALEGARDLFERHRAATRRWPKLFLQLARIHRLRQDLPAARDAVQKGLDRADDAEPKARTSLWQELFRIELAADDLGAAEEALTRASVALGPGETESIADAILAADRAELRLRQERWDEALQWALTALRLDREAETPDLNLEAYARYLKSVALAELGDAAVSRRAADEGLALLEALRDAFSDLGLEFFAKRQDYYRHRVDLAAVEDPQALWAVFESYRARGLLESSRLGAAPTSEDVADAEADRMITARRALAEAIWELDRWDAAADEERSRREEQVRQRRLELRELQAEQLSAARRRPPPREIELETARALLDPDTLGLVFAGGSERIHLLALEPRSGTAHLPLDVDRRRLREVIDELVRGSDPRRAEVLRSQHERTATDLGRVLLAPLGERLDAYRRLAIVVDGDLEGLPFAMLRHPRTGRFLVESHEIVYLPSFSVFAASRRRAATCTQPSALFLGLGDPIFGSEDPRWPPALADRRSPDEVLAFPQLPATADELEEIAALYPPSSTVLLYDRATLPNFLAEAPVHGLIHIASHARSDSEVPERSKIALSCVDTEGGSVDTCDLYFADLVTLDLCGRIVVLSACKTAGGRQLAGEGVLGLPRAFLLAGSSAVVASLWRVGDTATAELMVAFHRHLRGGADLGAALRRAQVEQLAAGRPANDWAAFVLLGDWRIPPIFNLSRRIESHESTGR